MPGYEMERFANLSVTEKAELTCSICQDLFRCPVVTNCCLQTFCEECITDWLNTNKSCPYDRVSLTHSQLSRPPRAMINMIGKLKIKCDFRENGCKEVVLLESLSTHLLVCKYNPQNKKCKKCFTAKTKLSHDCVQSLLEVNKNLNEELEKLKIENNSGQQKEVALIRELQELKKEKENFLKTIQEISNKETNITSSAIQFDLNSMRQRFRSGKIKREISIIRSDMKESMIADLKKITFSALDKQQDKSETLTELCSDIKKQMETKHSGHWQCIIFAQIGNFSLHHASGKYITYKIGDLTITVYQAKN